jgi:AraC-like DNA-binding protein
VIAFVGSSPTPCATLFVSVPHLEFAVSPSLSDAVHGIWYHEHTGAFTQTLLPDAFVELCVQVGDATLEGRALGGVYVVGLQDAPLSLRSERGVRVLGVRLYAWAALRVLGATADWQALETNVGACVARGDPAAGAAMLETWLQPRVAVLDANARAARLLYDAFEPPRVAALANVLGVSERTLERAIRGGAGVPPKRLARLVRFGRAVWRLFDAPSTSSLTELAFELGYADQAHFIREFRAFANVTPGEFVSDLFNPSASARE